MGRSGGGGGGMGGGFGGGGGMGGGFSGGNRTSGRSAGGSYGGSYGNRSTGGGMGGAPMGGGMRPVRMGGPVIMPVGGGMGPRRGMGGFIAIVVVIMVVLVALVLVGGCAASCSSNNNNSSNSIPESTVEREALPKGDAIVTSYYTDEGGWIGNATRLESGMKTFYDDTGVAPYLYILPNGYTTSVNELSSLAEQYYFELFNDSAHFLVVFCDNNHGGYNIGYYVGAEASTVMDTEALNIFYGYLERYYNDMSLSDEQMFSETFASTAERIMTHKESHTVLIIVLIIVIVVAGVVVIVVRKVMQDREAQRKHTEEVLNIPLEQFGDTDLDELEKKYSDSSSSDSSDSSKNG